MSNIPQREMTLEEWVNGLPDGHRARKELAQLESEHKMLRKFWDELTERLFESFSMDEFTVAELGVECGLLTEEIYEPEGKHKGMSMGESEPGELCYVNNLFTGEIND